MISLIILAAAQAAAPAMGQAQQMVVRQGPPPPKVEGNETCVPLTMAGGMPVIPVEIAGKKLNLAFDTGAPGGALLSEELVKELGLEKIGEARVADPSLRNVRNVGLYALKNMQVGSLKLSDWAVSERPPREPSVADRDGVMGPQAFAGYVVTFDYPGSRVLIRKGSLPEPDNRTSFRYAGAIPEAPMSIDGQTISAHIDSGNARYGLILPEEFAAKLPGYGQRFPIGVARTVTNRYDLSAVPVSNASLGALPLYAGTAATPGPGSRGNVGSLLLRDFVLKVDPANRIVALERARPGLENGCPNA